MPNLHRNNAAEWLMVIVLTPIVWIVRGWRKLRGPRVVVEPTEPVKRSVMIEGLPPRTMN